MSEPWRNKLPKHVVDRIDHYRAERDQVPVLSTTRIITSPHLTIDVPPGLMYKKVKIVITLEGEK